MSFNTGQLTRRHWALGSAATLAAGWLSTGLAGCAHPTRAAASTERPAVDAPAAPREFRAASAVVWQRDILLPTATVREAIMTSAELKLPQRMAWEEKRRRVDQIVQELVR